jgi:hypothetical protein
VIISHKRHHGGAGVSTGNRSDDKDDEVEAAGPDHYAFWMRTISLWRLDPASAMFLIALAVVLAAGTAVSARVLE